MTLPAFIKIVEKDPFGMDMTIDNPKKNTSGDI